MRFLSFLALLVIIASEIRAQNVVFQQTTYPVRVNGQEIKFPFTGGVNAPQISKGKLNNDAYDDLMVFDRAGDVILTFAGGGQGQYTYAPELSRNFPTLKNWALLRDFNRDGAPDIFCSNIAPSVNGVQVFEGYWQNGQLFFKPFLFHYPGCMTCETQYLYYPDTDMPGFWNNLVVAETDLPAFDDLDNDGDLDMLTFDPDQGGNIIHLKNESVEKGFGDDSLKLVIVDRCYGQMYESGIKPCSCDLSPDPNICIDQFTSGEPTIRHPGSTIMTFDQEGDGDKELVLGDISFNCLNYLKDGGTPTDAWMVEQDTLYPSYDVPVALTSFPAAYYVDVDDDGKKDMVVSPNSKNITDDDESILWYRNNGSNTNHQFQLQTRKLWQSDMIDIGSVSHPVFVDVNKDGLLDIVAGNTGYYTINNGVGNPHNASLYLWYNVGTADQPKYELNNRNWLNFAQFAPDDYDFAPAFGDLDNDGDLDLLVGSNGGILYFCENTAGSTNPMTFTNPLQNANWFLLDIGTSSVPAIWDIDKDGRADILIGERSGNINFFKNSGSPTQPTFANMPTIQNLGAIDTRTPPSTVGYSAPFVFSCGSEVRILSGNQEGKFEYYAGVVATTDSVPMLSAQLGNLDIGERSHPALADINNDGMFELLTGTSRGGLQIYQTNIFTNCSVSTTDTPIQPDTQIQIAPNPSIGEFLVNTGFKSEVVWSIFNSIGQEIAQGSSVLPSFRISIPDAKQGVYSLQLRADGVLKTEKLLVIRQ